MLRRVILTSSAAISALALSACSPATEGTPEQTNGSDKSTKSSEPTDPALQIENPKDVSALEHPCDVLTEEQLAQLGAAGESTTEDSPWGEQSCAWSNDNVSIDVAGDSTTGGGFPRLRENQDQFANFSETNVAGYPAARANSSDLLCAVAAGVSAEDTVLVNVAVLGSSDDPQHSDPCAFAEKVFAESVKNIPAES